MRAGLVPEVAEVRDHGCGSRGPTLLVFGDYECPYTRAAYRSVQSLEAEGVLFRFVFRHFPLVEIHPHARAAAEASEAAAAQGRFWPMHDLLFRRQQALARADLEGYAHEIGLVVERLRQELEAHVHLDRIEADRTSALASGARGHADALRRRPPISRLLGAGGAPAGARPCLRGERMTDVCTHLDTIQVTSLPENVPGCEDCLRIGGWWVHLRLCLTCGHVGCCDSSPNRHATAHARSLQHPIIRSLEPGEDWCWCYVDEIAFEIDLAGRGA